jgi:hypothetical protein
MFGPKREEMTGKLRKLHQEEIKINEQGYEICGICSMNGSDEK